MRRPEGQVEHFLFSGVHGSWNQNCAIRESQKSKLVWNGLSRRTGIAFILLIPIVPTAVFWGVPRPAPSSIMSRLASSSCWKVSPCSTAPAPAAPQNFKPNRLGGIVSAQKTWPASFDLQRGTSCSLLRVGIGVDPDRLQGFHVDLPGHGKQIFYSPGPVPKWDEANLGLTMFKVLPKLNKAIIWKGWVYVYSEKERGIKDIYIGCDHLHTHMLLFVQKRRYSYKANFDYQLRSANVPRCPGIRKIRNSGGPARSKAPYRAALQRSMCAAQSCKFHWWCRLHDSPDLFCVSLLQLIQHADPPWVQVYKNNTGGRN